MAELRALIGVVAALVGVVAALVGVVAALAWAQPALAAPPESEPEPESESESESESEPEPESLELRPLHGRVREAGGSRAPVSAAAVLVVAAAADVRVGKPAREPLDPEAVTWVRRAETDDEGQFSLPDVPVGKIRVVVIAGGYARLEQWAEVGLVPAGPGEALALYLTREAEGGGYRTEVVSEREQLIPPTHSLDAQQARHYAGSGDDALLAALNLPGVARTPGGLGVLSFRGAAPSWTGYILDGHPIPRGFHIIPVASVISPAMVDRIEFNPGSYGPGFGGYGGGLVQISSRAPAGDGVHGQVHVDLFDLGGAVSAPLGPGTVSFGARRSHVDAVLGAANRIISSASNGGESALGSILIPTYWDYLGRIDMPLAADRSLSVRALGAGDHLEVEPDPQAFRPNGFAFANNFHRFDLDYRAWGRDWKALLSPSLRLDDSRLEQGNEYHRQAVVLSTRMSYEARLGRRLTLEVGSNLLYQRWRRRQLLLPSWAYNVDISPTDLESYALIDDSTGETLELGLWLAPVLQLGDWQLIPALRLGLFSQAGIEFVRPDPRLELRGRLHPKLELRAQAGLYATPLVVENQSASANLLPSVAPFAGGLADVPRYIIDFFDPGIDGEVLGGSATVAELIQASLTLDAELPWSLRFRATGFWREGLPATIYAQFTDPYIDGYEFTAEVPVVRRRGMGLELLLSRNLGKRLDGWIGYTLAWTRIEDRRTVDTPTVQWLPTAFDQRHNLVILLSGTLPRGFRLGMRFRLVSGNPQTPVLGVENTVGAGGWGYRPLRGERGTSHAPLFHQLDLRLDKRWVRRRATITAYLDVQNVYDHRYPEVWVYSSDWSDRSALIGLPIYPSLGVQVDF